MNSWIPLWMFKDLVLILEERLLAFAKKHNTELENADILIDDFFPDKIKIALRGYDKNKGEYAFIQQCVTNKLLQDTMYSPEPKFKTAGDIMAEITDLLWDDERNNDEL